MADDKLPQYYSPAVDGSSEQVYKVLIDNIESLERSQIRARNRQYNTTNVSTLAIDGIPGIPFERGTPNPDVFYQGEDIIYDLYLFNDGKPVSSDDFDIFVSVKTSPRAGKHSWLGVIDVGIMPNPKGSGFYEVWIPSSATANFFAGSYYLTVLMQEKVGAGQGRYDRKYVLLNSYFNIDYGNFSPHPETLSNSADKAGRSSVELTWPNSPDTVGRRSYDADPFKISK
jgi:hypothetical protein